MEKGPLEMNRAGRTVYPILLMVCATHLLNDMMQSVIPAVYPLLKEKFGFTFAQIGLITLVFQLTSSLLQPVAGRLADRFGRGKVYGLASLLCGLSNLPSFWQMEGSGGTLFLIGLAIVIPLSVFYAGVFGPEAALFSDLFPPDVRYTGISIVYQFPGFLVAGIVPGLCTFLINWNEGDPLYVCLFTLLAAVTSALSAFAIQRKSIAAQRKHGDDAEHI